MVSSQKMVLLVVSLALFMEALDTTIINTAIPAMSQSLSVNPIDLKIALVSYLLSLAIFIPISGWIADKYGIKRVFIVALGVFTASSLWCGFAHNLWALVIARTLQGIGGSLSLPLGRLILYQTFERRKVVAISSRVLMVAALGTMLGPVLGGAITHYFSWRWIFWVNIPVGLLVMLMAQRWLVAVPPQAVPPLDKLGFVLFGTSLAGFTFGLSAFSESTLSFSFSLMIVMAAILLLIFYFWHSYGHPRQIVKTELFRFRTFQVSILGSLIARLGFGGVPFLLPILLQIGLGYSVQETGLLLAPIAFGILLVKPLSLTFLRYFGYKKLLTLNTLLVALSLCSFILINFHTSVYLIILLTFLFGFLVSLQYSAMNSLAYAEIPHQQLSAATSITSTLQQLAQSFGVAVSALLIHYFSPSNAADGFLLTDAVFNHVFFVMGIITFFSALIFMRLQADDGHQMIEKEV